MSYIYLHSPFPFLGSLSALSRFQCLHSLDALRDLSDMKNLAGSWMVLGSKMCVFVTYHIYRIDHPYMCCVGDGVSLDGVLSILLVFFFSWTYVYP